MTQLTTTELLTHQAAASAALESDSDLDTFLALSRTVREIGAEIARRTAAWYVATIPSWVAAEYGLPAGVSIEIAPEGDDVVIDGLTDANGDWLDVDDATAVEILERVEDLYREEAAIA